MRDFDVELRIGIFNMLLRDRGGHIYFTTDEAYNKFLIKLTKESWLIYKALEVE